MPTEGTHTMRSWISIIVLLCSLHGAGAQTDPTPFDHSPAIPFNIKLLSPRARVETLLKEHKFAVNSVPQVEGVAPGIYATNVEWNNTAFDTLFVYFTPTSGRAASLSLVRVCDSDKTGLIAAELTDVVSHSYGDPTYADETTARWERGNEAAISLGPYENNEAVWLRFDLTPLFQRRSTTRPTWPLALPVITDRDETREMMTDSCRKVVEEGDQLISTGCSCYGIKARKTTVYLDPEGRPVTIEMIVSRADQGALQNRLQAIFGPPNGLDAAAPTWLMDDMPAVAFSDAEEGLQVSFSILAMELLQYMDK
ncbi:MAG: hypothetical protein IPH49_06815 [Ignavibacteria bacterium]|nr:hypothetical protein [Ignavibacteria bacterium]